MFLKGIKTPILTIARLTKDCGAGGTFNGVHVVNNLTFAAFGVYGGKNIAIPSGAPPPDCKL